MDLLQVNDLHVSYGDSEVIHGVGIKVAEGESVALMGRNGMGKTTLFKSIIGTIPNRGGEILVDGMEVTHDPAHSRVAKGLSFVPQGRMIFPFLTVEENILTGLERASTKKIPAYIYDLFPVLKQMRRRKGGNLSGGQQQQLAIARALVSEPKVMLLDEPTEGIQPSIIKELAKTLVKIKNELNISILVSEQVLKFALAVADRLVVINRGRIVMECNAQDTDRDAVKRYLSV